MKELENLCSLSMISTEDSSFLLDISSELRETLSKRQIFRTETEMNISVLNDIKHPTSASKYWQSVREQGVMIENVIKDSFEFRRNEVQIKRIEKKLSGPLDDFDREEAQIELEECLFKRIGISSSAKDRVREIKLWSSIKKELDDGSFDSSNCDTHQLISYAKRFINQAYNAPEDMPVAEANNLYGQLITTMKTASKRGLLDEVLSGIPSSIINKVLVDQGILTLTSKE